ncbi:MAG TPA: TonB-dependent receptor [Candidatus Elarobacter sp.]|jgi:hypothetical protein|nr:TonB-dependent receptor [Candidatus Elarobacter sp.]
MALALAFVASLAAPALADTTTGNIQGTVTANGQPVAGVAVVAVAPSGRYTATTDAKGFFSMVGVVPDTYSVSFTKTGYGEATVNGVTVNPTITSTVNQTISQQLRTIGSTTSRSSGVSAFQPQQPEDTYSVNANQITTILGKSHAVSETNLIIALPGASLDSSGYPVLRGGRENDEGFQFEGIDYTDAFTHQFVNSLALNGVSNFQLSPGAGDASVGNVGTGQINATVKRGTRPAFGSFEGDIRGPVFDHYFSGEYGWATPDGALSSYTSLEADNTAFQCGRSGTDCNLVGQQIQENLSTGRDLIENAVYKFGKDKNQSLQAFYQNQMYEFYENEQFLPLNQVLYRTSMPDYIAYSASQLGVPTSFFTAIDPLEYGQSYLGQPLRRPAISYNQPNATLKLQYSNSINQSTFMTLKAYKVNATTIFDFPYAGQSCQGVLSGAECDAYSNQGGQRTGFAADFTKQVGTKHLLGFGAKYEFVHPIDSFQSASLGAIAVTFDNATDIYDFMPGQYLPTYLGLPAGAGVRVPDYNQSPTANRHDLGYYIQDQFQATDKLKITAGVRLDSSSFDYPTNPLTGGYNVPGGYSSGLFLPIATGTTGGIPDPTKDVYASNLYRTSSTLQPRFGFAYQFNPRNSITFNYGRSVELPPIAFVDERLPRSQYAGFAGIPSDANVCGPTADRVCRDYADQIYWDNQNVLGGVPIQPAQPSTFNNFDMSLQHDFGNGLSAKVTPFYRRGYNVLAQFSTPLVINGVQQFDINGNPLQNAPVTSNLGTSYTTGVEFYMTKTATYGLSGTLSLTYLNEFTNVIPLSGNEDFFPSIPYVSLAQGNLYRVGFVSPFNGTVALQYKWRSGWRLNPIFGFNVGYPIGTGLITAYQLNGKNYNLPSTNVTNPNGSTSATQYVDPANPGTVFAPNVAASRGTPEKNSPGGVLSAPRVNVANLDLEYNKPGTRNTFGVLVTNLFNQIYSQPGFNGRYQPAATGISGPKSGTTSAAPIYPYLGYVNYASFRGNNQPYLLTPSGLPTEYRVYYQLSL